MTNANSQELGLLAKLVMDFAALLIAEGVLWHGVTIENLQRNWSDLTERPDAPMRCGFILQPLMCAIAATHDGLEDGWSGRSPFFQVMLREPQERAARLREALNATAKIILLGLAMDVIYQVLVLKTFYPVEAVIVALLLASVPYITIRGLVLRAWRRRASAARVRRRHR